MHNENLQISAVNPSKKPVLSLILCSRNDQYLGNSRWRLQTALNYLAQKVHELGREEEVEVIVSDWGSEIPLHSVLELNSIAERMVSFVIIPPTLAQKLQKDSPFSEVHALNAAARRVNGQYIGRIDQDTLVGKQFLNTFFEMHEGIRPLDVPLDSVLLFILRRSISYRFAVRCPSLWKIDRFINWFGRSLPVETTGWNIHEPWTKPGKPFFYAPVGIWLLHRDLWYDCGGYDERFIYMNEMEMDMIERLIKKYRFLNSKDFLDYDFYHLEHYHPLMNPTTSRKENPRVGCDNVLHPNSENWGLIQYSLQILSYDQDQISVNAETMLQHRSNWTAFIFLLLLTKAQMTLDSLIIFYRFRIGRAFLSPLYYAWKKRAKIAWEIIYRHPVAWPVLLIKLWIENRHNRTHNLFGRVYKSNRGKGNT